MRGAQSFFQSLIPIHRALRADIEGKGKPRDYAHQAATIFTLKTLFLKIAEDMRLLPRRGTHKIHRRVEVYRDWFKGMSRSLDWGDYLVYALRDMAYHRLAYDLFKETEYEEVPPSSELVEKLLKTVDELGDLSDIDTRLLGDLYEHLMEPEEQKRLGYYTTPDHIIEFLLDRTLEPAFERWDFRDVRYLDPACGTGHFLVRAYRRFAKRYHREYPDWSEIEIFKHVVENHLFGVDVSEFAARIALFRLMLEGVRVAGAPDDFPDISFNIYVANTLVRLPREVSRRQLLMDEPLRYREDPVARLYGKEAIHLKVDLTDAFSKGFHVINANPPYVRVQKNEQMVWDSKKRKEVDFRDYLRSAYTSAYSNFDLSVPFLERALELCVEGGFVGFITSGKFAKQSYGRKLVEEVLPGKANLRLIADLTDAKVFDVGAYPMLLMLERSDRPDPDGEVEVLATYQPKGDGEETWKHLCEIAESPRSSSHFDPYIGRYSERQSHFRGHPWTFRRSKRNLLEKIKQAGEKTLDEITHIGCDFMSNADPVFVDYITESFIRRNGLEREVLIPCLRGENVRNWMIDWHGNRKRKETYVIALHTPKGERLGEEEELRKRYPNVMRFLSRYRDLLESRRIHSTNVLDAGIRWYELAQSTFRRGAAKVTYSRIAATPHFFLEPYGEYAAHQTLYVIYGESINEETWTTILGVLNSTLTNYYMKQVATKRMGGDKQGGYIEWLASYMKKFPFPKEEQLLQLDISDCVQQLLSVACSAMSYSMHSLVREAEYRSAEELLGKREETIAKYRAAIEEMKRLQDELDHLVYRLYGITDPGDIAELEQPLYKRPWKEPDWDKEFEFEVQDYICDLVEAVFARGTLADARPLSAREIEAELRNLSAEEASSYLGERVPNSPAERVEALRSIYYGGGLTLTADFIRECIETDCRPIPYDPQKFLVGRGAKKVDILHERFLKPLIPGGEVRYGWTGWSPEIQVNVFLGLAEEVRSKGGDPEPFRSWVREKVLPDLSEEFKRQVEEYLI